MGIFTKLSTVIKSNINDLISRAENPEKMLNQIILDMRDQLGKAKREVASAIADERKLKSQTDGEVKQARDWQHRAMLAVKEGRDDLAKQALMRQKEHTERAQVLQSTWEAQASETEKLKSSLRQLNDKIEEAKRKRNLLIAKQKRAQAQRRIHETMSGLSDTSAFEAFNRMADKIEEEERKSVASAEINEALSGGTLESEFLRLEAGDGGVGVEDQLLALKAEMGLIAPPSDKGPAKQLGDGSDDDEDAGGVQEADVEEVSDEEAANIPEAQLLSEFDKLGKRADA
ncbi:MAG: PspA/IM30 family protein [Gemmatimonadota bacterium]|nr:PspA/IM30 family protein [Gemmatimonadota bacterium]MDH3421871.1 PspA/IM30 family protein [Gemmatimonadota bacterium]